VCIQRSQCGNIVSASEIAGGGGGGGGDRIVVRTGGCGRGKNAATEFSLNPSGGGGPFPGRSRGSANNSARPGLRSV